MHELGATPDRPYRTSSEIITALRDRHGMHLDQGYDALIESGAEWLVPATMAS